MRTTKWIPAVLAVAAAAAAMTPGAPGEDPVTGRVETASGRAAAGAMVTATLPDGRTVTVYADRGGAFTLPDGVEGAELRGWLPGVGEGRVTPSADGPVRLRLAAADGVPPAGSAWIAALPEGEDARRFIVDCTGCHVTDGTRVRAAGAPRDSASWHAAVQLMRSAYGPGTGFPIISDWARPGRLAGWLEDAFAETPASRPLPGPTAGVGAGAVLTEYPVPVPQDLPHDLMVDAEGQVLVTGMFTHRMYRLDPATGVFETTPIPVENANPRALDVDAEGRWWLVLGAPGSVAVHDPATGEWDVHDVGMYAHSIHVGPDGRGWVNGHFSHDPEVVAALDAATGAVERHTVPPPAGEAGAESTIPYGLRVADDGTVWGTQLRGNGLIRLDPETGAVDRWEIPVSHAGPRRPDLAPDGTVWIPLYGADALARFDPETETFRVWDFPVEGALPYVARVHQDDGTVWIGTGHGDMAASFDPGTERFTLYPLPTRGALVRHLDVDEERDEIWLAYGASPGIPGEILRIQPGG